MHSQTRIGRYEVVSTLGQGAMGTVYKAVDPLIERAVAIKTINLNLSKEERAEFEERFYREAKSAGRLSHANIVTIYDVGEVDDVAYIAMEYLEGESLREMLDSGVVLPLEMIGSIAARIAHALNYAHENHVVHRDIKPANIMITSSRDVKIMDFGIAQIPTGSRTQVGTVLGSPKYMAPEQVVGRPTDGKTDIFALGVVLYEMLTGVTPFNGDNLGAIMYKILNEEPAPPSTLNPRVPPVFDRVVGRALSKRPEDRYQSAREFAFDLNPDATLPLGTPSPAASPAPEKTGQAGKAAAGQQDATVFLPPHKAQAIIASPPAREKPAVFLAKAGQARKPLLFAIPVLVIAAFAMYLQGAQPNGDKVAILGTQASEAGPGNAPLPPGSSGDAPQPATPPGEALQAAALQAGKVAAPPRTPAIASAPSVPAAASTAPPVAAPLAKATILFAVSPWGEVYVDGKNVGVSPPLASLQLASGKHRVEIRNQAFTPYRDTVNLKSGESFKIRHKF